MDLRVKRHIEMTETFQLVEHLKINQGIVVLICLHLMILPRLASPGGSNSNAGWSSLSWNKDENLEETV